MNPTKYPRTPHLPWSTNRDRDDTGLDDVSHFVGKRVVVTEKMDGENTSIYSGGLCHARSTDSTHHSSQSWVRQLAARTAHEIPHKYRLCGENVYARHTLVYDSLPSYFLLFAVHDGTRWLSWEGVRLWADLCGLHTVPILYEGEWDEAFLKKLTEPAPSQYGPEREGYVVRLASSFPDEQFSMSVAKYRRMVVPEGTRHWRSAAVIPNLLAR